jgi:hypothetical protein
MTLIYTSGPSWRGMIPGFNMSMGGDMEIVLYVRIRTMYGICLIINEEDPSVRHGRILFGLTCACGVNRYAGWKEVFMWRSK